MVRQTISLFIDDVKMYSKGERQLKSLKYTVRIFSDDVDTEFVIEDSVMLKMKWGIFEGSQDNEKSDGQTMKTVKERISV